MRRPFHTLALYLFHITFARPMVRWVAGVRYRRKSLLPKGPCIVVSNHNSHLDAAVLMGLFPLRRLPRVHPVAAADYFGSTRLRRTMAMMMMNAIAIDRRPLPGRDPLAPVVEALAAGDSLIFFPEGSRGEAGVMARFRPGIGRIVRQTPGVLVVPVFLSGPERIWPRGQMVPVPLNIDVVVGKPRSYSPEEDPRAIAERVQRAVTGLAPPLPPLHAAHPQPSIRVAVCGLDAESRVALFDKIALRLGRLGDTLGVSERILEVDADGAREVPGPIPQTRRQPWTGLFTTVFRARGRLRGRKFAALVERAQIDEALGNGRAARFVVTDGSALVDLLAWASAEFYREADEAGLNRLMQYLAGQTKIPFGKWWSFIRKAPEVWLINEFELARPPVPDVLVQINRPVPDLMRRLRSRGEELGPQETEPFLERLQAGYLQVGHVLKKRRQVDLLEYDLSVVDLEEVAAEVEAHCARTTSSAARASRRS